MIAPLTAKLVAQQLFFAKGLVSAIGVDCLVSPICVSDVNICVIYLGVIRYTNLKTRVVFFLYLTLSENESKFNLENISADGVKKAHCKIIRAALFRHLLIILS